jgi:hypothetical protein
MKLYKLIRLTFTTKAQKVTPVAGPATANPAAKKAKPKSKKNSPVYNLLMTQKLLGSKNEVNNYYENTLTNTKNKASAHQMLLNYYKNVDQQDKDNLTNLYNFIHSHLHSKELTSFFNLITETQKILCSEDLEKSEELFQAFINKLNKLTDNKSKKLLTLVVNESLLDHITKVPFSSINISEMNQTLVKKQLDTNPALHFTQLESIYKNTLVLNNPMFNDLENPVKDLKDVISLY